MSDSAWKADIARRAAMRHQVIAVAVGEGELWAKARAPTALFDDSRPTTKIRLIVQ
ncbi:MAG: hypothetical protein M3Z05_09240 [Gemmatimonadota bacterium]|nr:hypothetical protein [Gemmatimonadota bacterium]